MRDPSAYSVFALLCTCRPAAFADNKKPGASRTLANLAAHGVSDVVEHTDLDSYWGDGLDGSGFNVLGKLIGRLLQYARTGDPQWLGFPAEGLHQPAAESLLYP